MGDAEYTFAQARARLEDIVGQVRKKDMSLERSLDLLEEGVRLANVCTEQIDQSEWRAVAEELEAEANRADETASGAQVDSATDAWMAEPRVTESAGVDETRDPADPAGPLGADVGDDDGEPEPISEQ